MLFSRLAWTLAAGACLLCAVPAAAAAPAPIALTVDLSEAPTQSIARIHEVIPVSPGPLTLLYPKWIPGEHGPVGPMNNVAALTISANGRELPWTRDAYDMFATHVTIPAGATALDVDFTYLGATYGYYSNGRFSTPNIVVVDWNQDLFYPSTGTFGSVFFDPTLILPGADWKFATALYHGKREGNRVTWSATSLERLLDSPLDACTNFRSWTLWTDTGAFPGSARLNACADTPEELDASDETIGHYKKLVREMLAMYGARHWYNYDFLLTVSDTMQGEGVEHHESSDDGDDGGYLIDEDVLRADGDLLSHEFNHSWDGKYRMPAGMYPKSPNDPLDDSLLWVYEGMTQYYGDVMSWRDGIMEAKTWPDHIAALYAAADSEPGRAWRSLDDTARSEPFLADAPRGDSAERRSDGDYYEEGELLWLKVDSIIRNGTHGSKSLDTFARAFFGQENTGPIVKTYDRADVIAVLNRTYPYDWARFFHARVDGITSHPPDGFTADGWKLEYTEKPQQFVHASNFRYSIGVVVRNNDVVSDVLSGSPAWKAGLGLGDTIVAADGRAFSDSALNDALLEAQKSHRPIALIVSRDDRFRTISLSYDGGPRYPHLVRIPGTPDLLRQVIAPRSK